MFNFMGIENPEVKKRFNPDKEPSSNNGTPEDSEVEKVPVSDKTDNTITLSDKAQNNK